MIGMGMRVDQPVDPPDSQGLQQRYNALLRLLIRAVQHPAFSLIKKNGRVLIPDSGKPDFQQIRVPGEAEIRIGLRIGGNQISSSSSSGEKEKPGKAFGSVQRSITFG